MSTLLSYIESFLFITVVIQLGGFVPVMADLLERQRNAGVRAPQVSMPPWASIVSHCSLQI
jgi:hypothetical protein